MDGRAVATPILRRRMPDLLRRSLEIELTVFEDVRQGRAGLGGELGDGSGLDGATGTGLGLVGAVLHVDGGIER